MDDGGLLESLGPAAVVGAGVLVVVAILLFANHLQRLRQERLAEVARLLGLDFIPGVVDGGDPFGCLMGLFGGGGTARASIIARLDGFDPFGRGDSRRASNLLSGRRAELDWQCFDYQYSTGSGKSRSTHHFGIAAATVPMVFAGLQIRPESVLDRVASIVGWKDIQFEMEAFNRRYFVTSPDAQEAYGILHPQAMEFLMGLPPRHWQIKGSRVVLMQSGSYSAEELFRVISDVEDFLKLLPPYLDQDLRARSAYSG
ncbi:MAG: DUF3137 domain-containing protein [Fimbriimonadaceae bacterium]|nr:hypothetical protein [Chthonomonadaceae bacterium]MCO5296550.1 DUF3137 domain-containing protein [Fimbriimonadaceae bacterium]